MIRASRRVPGEAALVAVLVLLMAGLVDRSGGSGAPVLAAVAAFHENGSPIASPLAGTPVASPVGDASTVALVNMMTDDYDPGGLRARDW